MAVAIANDDRARLDRIAGGDQDAFASLYEEYFPGVHDFALRTLRNPDQAADVVQLTFVRAWEHIRSGDRPDSVKAWLYTIARNGAIDEIRRGKRTVLEDSSEMPSPMELQIDPDRIANPEEVVRDQELVALVWEAASALNPRDYTMLDLHLRKDLAPDELAESMGLRRDHVYVLLSRLRASLGDAVTDLLLLRRGRKECPQLDAILTAEGATTLTPEARKAIRLHVKSCAICQEQRRRFVSPVALFSAIPPAPVPFEVKQAIWQDILRDIHAAPSPGETRRVEPHQPGAQTGSGFRAKAMAAAGALIAIVLLALVVSRIIPPVQQVAAIEESAPPISIAGVPDAGPLDQPANPVPEAQGPNLTAVPGTLTASEDPFAEDPGAQPPVPGQSLDLAWPALTEALEAGIVQVVEDGQPAAALVAVSVTVAGADLAIPAAAAPAAAPPPPPGAPEGAGEVGPEPLEPAPRLSPLSAAPVAIVPPTETPGTPLPEPQIRDVLADAPPPRSPRQATPTFTTQPADPVPPSITATLTPQPMIEPPDAEVPVPPGGRTAEDLPSSFPARPSTPTRTAIPSPTPTLEPTVAPPTLTQSRRSTLTRTPSPTLSQPPMVAACAELSDADLVVSPNPTTNEVSVTWSSTGGCAPFTGVIAARYERDSAPYQRYPISQRSGTLMDSPPQRCGGPFVVVFTLTLTDRESTRVSATSSTTVRWTCSPQRTAP